MHQLTLKQGGYYGLLTWAHYKQMNPEKQERKAEEADREMMKEVRLDSLFLEGTTEKAKANNC